MKSHNRILIEVVSDWLISFNNYGCRVRFSANIFKNYLFFSMSAHEGVSCDACGKSNFRSKRYKCLICYDYDLCSTCYEQGEASSHHSNEHPMQCKTN